MRKDAQMKGADDENLHVIIKMHWKATACLFCFFGIVKKFRPATPFLTPLLVSPDKNFTVFQLYSQIYPIWTYSYMVALIPIFFLTDILRYKPIVICEATCYCVTMAIILWGKKVWQMQIMETAYGLSTASEIAYMSYIYAVVDQKYFRRITSYTRAATLLGKCLAYGFGQLLISFDIISYLQLVQISFGSSCIMLLVAFMLPSLPSKVMVKKIIRETDNPPETPETVPLNEKITADDGIVDYFRTIWEEFKIFKNNTTVLKWSIWWILSGCGTFQVQNYVQNLWAIMQHDGKAYNGITECAATLFSAIVSFLAQYIKTEWPKFGEMLLLINTAVSAGLLITMSQTHNALVAYVFYVAFIAIYQLFITVASHIIASQLNTASYGLIFGWNTFTALFLQTILTLIVADEHGLALDIRAQVAEEEEENSV